MMMTMMIMIINLICFAQIDANYNLTVLYIVI